MSFEFFCGTLDKFGPFRGRPSFLRNAATPDWSNLDKWTMTMGFRSGLAAFASILAWSAFDVAVAQSPHKFTGTAAYYSTDYSGRTARGDRYDPTKFTAAHRSLPFGTRLRVTDPRSKRSVVVVVNDRGPFSKGRVLDLSLAAAKALNMTGRGLLNVTAVVEPGTTTFTTTTATP
jgi:peptidoglycan lytic transglycosylase